MNVSRVVGIGLAVCLLGAVGLVFRHSGQFGADLRRSVVESRAGLELCGFESEKTQACVVLSANEKSAEFTKLVNSLSTATWTEVPGKVPIVRERILRVREVGFSLTGVRTVLSVERVRRFPR
jgi:hypothetical protein